MDSGPGRPGSLADRGLLPFLSGSGCLRSAWGRSLREGYCHELGLLLCLSLTLCCAHTHTHTCIQTHTPTLSPTCLLSQSALALLCSDTCCHSHLIIPSISLSRLALNGGSRIFSLPVLPFFSLLASFVSSHLLRDSLCTALQTRRLWI